MSTDPERQGALDAALRALYSEASGSFDRLVAAAQLDPASDFRDRDLRELRFHGADLRGFDFTGSNLEGTGLRHAGRIDGTTTLEGAILDSADRAWRQERPLRAIPKYIASHDFVGRVAELEMLNDWAMPTDPNAILVIGATGGSGKSMLAWHWLTQHAQKARADWVGRFWYSFYEQSTTLRDFCIRALEYMTGRPVEELRETSAIELGDRLISELDGKPWLLVLDGLEQLLSAYSGGNAANIEDVRTDDQEIREERGRRLSAWDESLLRRMAGVTRSKLLISTRYLPAAFNIAGNELRDGVYLALLTGLDAESAEAMFRACGVRGESEAIRAFLDENCGGNPLLISVLGGLVAHYRPDPGNFMAWRDDPAFGSKAGWAAIDRLHRQDHLLGTAISDLDTPSWALLRGLASFPYAISRETLEAINPFLPSRSSRAADLVDPEMDVRWPDWDEEKREQEIKRYRASREQARADRDSDPAVIAASARLANAVSNLERRGLLHYDPEERRYGLHPIVLHRVIAGSAAKEWKPGPYSWPAVAKDGGAGRA